METGSEAEILEVVAVLGQQLQARGWMLSCAESCTGGWVAKLCTELPGSSSWFERGFVTYTNEAKQEMLGVSAETLAAHGAVSEATAREMAAGALRHSRAQVSLAISGIAGPGGGTAEKPVGTVCLGWATGEQVWARTVHFVGDRIAVRRQAVAAALSELVTALGTE